MVFGAEQGQEGLHKQQQQPGQARPAAEEPSPPRKRSAESDKVPEEEQSSQAGIGGAPETVDTVCVHRWRGPSSVTVILASPTGDEDT